MRVNTAVLKDAIKQSRSSVSNIAGAMGIHKSTLYRKISNDAKNMTVQDAHKLVESLGLTREQAIDIFFAS